MNIRKFLIRWPALTLALIVVQIVSGIVTNQLFAAGATELFPDAQPEWLEIFIIAAVEAAAFYYLLTRMRLTRSLQILLLFMFYWGSKYFQMEIESAFFLNIWQSEPLMSWPAWIYIFICTALIGLLYCPLAVYIAGTQTVDHATKVFLLPAWQPALIIALIYVPIYFIAGMLLAVPLAGSAFAGTYENLHPPVWLPIFQFGRGLLWAVILWPVIAHHTPAKDGRVTLAVTLSIFTGIQMLLPNPYMETQLRYAHMAEIMVSMAVFGWLTAWLFQRHSGRKQNVTQCNAAVIN